MDDIIDSGKGTLLTQIMLPSLNTEVRLASKLTLLGCRKRFRDNREQRVGG